MSRALDNLQKKGNVNTVWAYTYKYTLGARNTPNGPIPLPDHGAYGDPRYGGGSARQSPWHGFLLLGYNNESRRMIGPCSNHPDYRAHLIGKIESVRDKYPKRDQITRFPGSAAFESRNTGAWRSWQHRFSVPDH